MGYDESSHSMPTCAEQTTDAPNKCLNLDRDVPGRLQDCQGQDCLQEGEGKEYGQPNVW